MLASTVIPRVAGFTSNEYHSSIGVQGNWTPAMTGWSGSLTMTLAVWNWSLPVYSLPDAQDRSRD